MASHELWMTAVRAVAVYCLALLVIRIMGKRTVGNFTAFDLLVALMLGEVVDEIIYGEVPFAQGTVAILTIASAHYANSWLSYWGHGFDKLLEGTPTVVVRDGQLQRKGMRAERMNENEVRAELRLNDVDDLEEVRVAMVETDGQVSVLRQEWARTLQKGDLEPDAHPKSRPRT